MCFQPIVLLHSMIDSWHRSVICLSVCLSVMLCIVVSTRLKVVRACS